MSKVIKKLQYWHIYPEKLIPIFDRIEQNYRIISGFRISFLKQIIYLICTMVKDDGYAYLKMSYLKRVIPQGDQYIHLLLKKEIIERTPYYKPGARSYGYCISSPYRSTYISSVVTDNKLIRRLETFYTPEQLRNCPQCKLISNLEIAPEAEEFAKKTYSGESLNYALSSIYRIKNRDFISSFDKTSGRYHSNLTLLHKELRPFILINGKHLKYNIDIKNSQPYFSTLILTNPEKVSLFAKDPNLSMILKTLVVPNNKDINHYINLVTTGKFYEYLIPYFVDRGLVETKWKGGKKREEVKQMMMRVLYDCNRKERSKAKSVFAERFPTVDNIFYMIRGNAKGNHFEGYQRFAILLQTIEAHVMHKIILKKIYRMYPGIEVFSIHDSILLPNDRPEKIERIMNKELEEFVGFPPFLQIERIGLNTLSYIINNSKKERIKETKKPEIVISSFSTIMIPKQLFVSGNLQCRKIGN